MSVAPNLGAAVGAAVGAVVGLGAAVGAAVAGAVVGLGAAVGGAAVGAGVGAGAQLATTAPSDAAPASFKKSRRVILLFDGMVQFSVEIGLHFSEPRKFLFG